MLRGLVQARLLLLLLFLLRVVIVVFYTVDLASPAFDDAVVVVVVEVARVPLGPLELLLTLLEEASLLSLDVKQENLDP